MQYYQQKKETSKVQNSTEKCNIYASVEEGKALQELGHQNGEK